MRQGGFGISRPPGRAMPGGMRVIHGDMAGAFDVNFFTL